MGKAAQPCLPSCSSLVPLPQHRRTTSSLAAEHPGALLLPQQTSPSLSGSSPLDLPLRKTVMLRERMCWLETRRSLSLPPPRSSFLRGRHRHLHLLRPSPAPGLAAWQGRELQLQEGAGDRAEVEKNLPTWFRTPAGGCDDVPSSTTTSRLILNKDNNDSGDQAALCVKSAGKDTFELLTGETTSCKDNCCVFNCKSCKAPES